MCQLTEVLTDRLPAILTEVAHSLEPEFPDYARFLAGEFDEVVSCATLFVAPLLSSAGLCSGSAAHRLDAHTQSVFESVGRDHCTDGLRVEGLLAAYRTGAAIAWRHIAEAAVRLHVPADGLADIATVLFTAVDQFSAASLRGYLDAQVSCERHREQLNAQLAEALLTSRLDPGSLDQLAERAGWSVPERAALVLTPVDTHSTSTPPTVSTVGALAGCPQLHRRDACITVVPDPDGPGRRQWLAKALRGSRAVVGEATQPTRLSVTLPAVELASTLRAHEALPLPDRRADSYDVLFVDEHLAELIVHRDPALLQALRAQALAPLLELGPNARQRQETTLRCWLAHMGNRTAMAEELHIHPQTVRYRIGQLRTLFGDRLDDPRRRVQLALALAWTQTQT